MRKRSAVIVSHDILMALKFGDTIILIEKRSGINNKDYGYVGEESVYNRIDPKGRLWKNHLNQELSCTELYRLLRQTIIKQYSKCT